MGGGNRLPLIKKAMIELTEMPTEHDRVGIVTYADNTRVLLPSVSVREQRAIIDSIDELSASGGTNGAGGIQAAYKMAKKNLMFAIGLLRAFGTVNSTGVNVSEMALFGV